MADVNKYPTGEVVEPNSIDESDSVSLDEFDMVWSDCLALEEQVRQLTDVFDSIAANFNGIADIEDFKYRLRQDNLLTPELEDFIEYYMKYRNKEILEELIPDEY